MGDLRDNSESTEISFKKDLIFCPFNQVFEDFVQCVLITVTYFPQLLSGPHPFPSHITLCSLYFHSSAPIVLLTCSSMHNLLEEYSRLLGQHFQRKVALFQQLSIANGSLARDRTSSLPYLSVMRSVLVEIVQGCIYCHSCEFICTPALLGLQDTSPKSSTASDYQSSHPRFHSDP